MSKTKLAGIAVGLLLVTGCYHATVETGLTPSTQTLSKRWAAGWIYGLVPPSTVETIQRCPSGVAKVETQLSFANQLVNFLTLGIYTPMEIVVTCAQRQANADIPIIAVAGDLAETMELVVRRSVRENTAVLVVF